MAENARQRVIKDPRRCYYSYMASQEEQDCSLDLLPIQSVLYLGNNLGTFQSANSWIVMLVVDDIDETVEI